jgi:hypothetical protein
MYVCVCVCLCVHVRLYVNACASRMKQSRMLLHRVHGHCFYFSQHFVFGVFHHFFDGQFHLHLGIFGLERR